MKPRLPWRSAAAWTTLLALLAAWLLTWSPPGSAAEGAEAALELARR
ncbi:MAG: hypothetical protein Q7U26_13750 [Aquabacterium sp.]|nr:hypothetical protein [Aquabacterium sp.]